ncbi:hypothetical protein AB0D11_33805 [Streptomyces monashensis]|uniref:hypothetical protein n=1 Tax=Streptomyces monashensis TaxID=1678012 RepID=UPI0033E40B2D
MIAPVCSANQDARRFGESVGSFDPSRPSASAHLAFGHGAHFCLGAARAGAEPQIAVSGCGCGRCRCPTAPGTAAAAR